MKEKYLTIQNISKHFGEKAALDNISLTLYKASFTCFLGPSGCGKTTLLRIISGLEAPDTGRIFLKGADITTLPPSKRSMGIVFQSYALFPNLTVAENIAYGLEAKKKLPKKEKKEIVREMLSLVNLEAEKGRYPYQISGGQQQRVALARALAISPKVLLLDEPLSALDAKVRHKLRKELRKIHDKTGVTTVMVTHDQDEALSLADEVVVMNHGMVEQSGTPDNIYSTPANPFVADFIGSMNFFWCGNNLCGIRPENIQIGVKGLQAYAAAEILGYEFRGSIFRVQIALKEGRYAGEIISADVAAEQFAKVTLVGGKSISVHIPKDRLIDFPLHSHVLPEVAENAVVDHA